MAKQDLPLSVDFIKNIFEKRVAKNPSYSLRALARSLGVSPSHLSQIFSGKKRFSPEMALKVGEKLGLSALESDYFYVLAQLDASKSPSLKASLKAKLRELDREFSSSRGDAIAIDAIGEWYHIPIMEMTFLDEPVTAALIKKRLGISTSTAQAALDALMNVGLIVKDESGRLRKTEKNVEYKRDRTNPTFRAFHKTMIKLGEYALAEHAFEDRVFNSQTFCVSRSKLPLAREIIRDFLRKMVAVLDDDESKTDVYQLSVQFFNLTDGVPVGEKLSGREP